MAGSLGKLQEEVEVLEEHSMIWCSSWSNGKSRAVPMQTIAEGVL